MDEQITYYRRRASEFDATTTPSGDPFAAQGLLLEQALEDFRAAGKVLEIACGTGTWTRLLVQHARELVALDSSPEMLELARPKVGDANVAFVQADLFAWEPDQRFDVVAFANWLSHVPPTRFESFWSLVEHCLAPGGRVFFVDEAVDAWRNEERPAGDRSTHVVLRKLADGSLHRIVKVFYDPEELEARLRSMGWDVSVTTTGVFYWGEGRRA